MSVAVIVVKCSASSSPSSAMRSRTTCTTVPSGIEGSKAPQTPAFSARPYGVRARARAHRAAVATMPTPVTSTSMLPRSPGPPGPPGSDGLIAAASASVAATSRTLRDVVDVVIGRGNDVGPRNALDHDGEPERGQRGRRAEPEVDPAPDVRGGRVAHRPILDDGERLRDRQRALARGARKNPPRQKHDAEPDHANDEQRMPRILPREETEEREDRGDGAETDDPERGRVRHAFHHHVADDHPRQKRAETEGDAGGH